MKSIYILSQMASAPAGNVDRVKTLINVSKQFPKRRKPENIAKVIFAGLTLNAVSLESARKRVEFKEKGADSYGVSLSVKLEVLNIKKFRAPPFFSYKRTNVAKPKNDIDRRKALLHERLLIYKHLSDDSAALRTAVKVLKLQESSIDVVKSAMEDGDLYKQIKSYDDVFKSVNGYEAWENEEYGYYWMGYRRRSALYWLTEKGKGLVVFKKD